LVSNAACTHLSDSFHPLPPAKVAGLLGPRDPEPLRRQCELHAVVHSQLESRVVEMVRRVAGAFVAAQGLTQSGLTAAGYALNVAAIGAFLDSFAGALRVAGAVAIGGAILAATFLPSRPMEREPGAPAGLQRTLAGSSPTSRDVI
jgi:hypothetical protein